MSKTFPPSPFKAFLHSFIFLLLAASCAVAEDRFALAVGAHDMLVVFGPKGDRVAELPIPSISQPVTIGATSFQISYGRDANDLLTAILAPNPAQPQDLHFTVLNKQVDADQQAVVTVTFSRAMNHVMIDPGYVGLVQVNSEKIRHHELADESSPSWPSKPVASNSRTSAAEATDMAQSPNLANAPDESSPASPPALASNGDHTLWNTEASGGTDHKGLFWSEPITPPGGSPPQVGMDQMKLVEVQGPVSVRLADGSTREGQDGMILPSGSTVLTSSDSSAAVFMGGVNSARLLPDSEVGVTQNVRGSVRKTTLDLRQGTVFSRVGHRSGEKQDYEVRTPEGVAAARGTEFADHRGSGHHYVFVAKGIVELLVGGAHFGTLTGSSGDVGSGAMPPASDTDRVLHNLLGVLQPYNQKLQAIFARLDAGNASPADLAYLNGVVHIFDTVADNYNPSDPNAFLGPHTSFYGWTTIYGSIPGPNDPFSNPLDLTVPERRNEAQDFQPFGTNPLTRF